MNGTLCIFVKWYIDGAASWTICIVTGKLCTHPFEEGNCTIEFKRSGYADV